MSESRFRELGWVRQVKTVDAVDQAAVDAMMENPGWQLLAVGQGKHGQTTLTFGWGWNEQFEALQEDTE